MLHRTLTRIILIVLLTGAAGAGVYAQDESPASPVSLYETPDAADPIAALPPGDAFTLEGRNMTGTWLLLKTAGGGYGWAERSRLKLEEGQRLADLPVVSAPASDMSADYLKLYAGPGIHWALIAALPRNTWLVIDGRNFPGTWLLVHTNDGALRGWVEQRHSALTARNGLYALPVISTVPDPTPAAETDITLLEGPGADYPAAATVAPGAPLVIEGRSADSAWLLVHTSDQTARGWITASDITLNEGTSLTDLSVIDPDSALLTIDLYPAPGTSQPASATIPHDTRLWIEGRNEAGTWLLVYRADDPAVRGWIRATDITLDAGTGVMALAVIGAQPTASPSATPAAVAAAPAEQNSAPAQQNNQNSAQPAAPPAPVQPPPYQPSGASVDAMVARLYGVPAVPAAISARARQIMQRGAQLGMRRDVFSKVGDCHTDHLGFLHPLGVNEYELGPYSYLQSTIDYFSATAPRPGVLNSFENASLAAETSFTAAAVLDPTWADPAHCQPGESPLACEYRVVKPGISIIMLGTMDVTVYGPEAFNTYLRQVVAETINRGIVPVLTTFPGDEYRYWAESLQFNTIILDVARDEGIPVINYWLASRALPNYGLTDDHLHLTYKGERRLNIHGPGDRWMSFSGDERVWGHTLRNLITLQTLALLR
ncbi:MAG: SH3 domain-containing protein [Anaerolineae bacterium]|nr:SH3 domain-containing protein [Anaerolineae bacterium]